MKLKITFLIFLFVVLINRAQEKQKSNWFEQNVKIGQSMSTSDYKVEPAQLQITLTDNKKPSYLINLGTAIKIIPDSTNNFISRMKFEYHRNTLTDEEQDNIELGYQATWNFYKLDKDRRFFMVFDPKYVYDGIKIKNSFATDILVSYFATARKLNVNADTDTFDNQSFFFSIFGGGQIQQIFKASDDSSEGFIIRPMAKITTSYSFLKKGDTYPQDPLLSINANYTARYDSVNTTDYNEYFTDLLKIGLDYYFLKKNGVNLSLGASYNYGSDPLAGLAKQTYYLLSLNVSKK